MSDDFVSLDMRAQNKLKDHVYYLAQTIGPRSTVDSLEKTVTYIETKLCSAGYLPEIQEFSFAGSVYKNIYVSVPGEGPAIVIGAHYDSYYDTPGADDNASAVSVLLELAADLRQIKPRHSLYFVFFSLEEPPAFRSKNMGSYHFARMLKDKNIALSFMISLEMLGYYSDEPVQEYPDPRMLSVYPKEGNFIGVVANPASEKQARDFFQRLKKHLTFDAQILIAPEEVRGVDLSDQQSFWRLGYPAFMITDTAFFRNKNYHQPTDLPDTLDYEKMSRLLEALIPVLSGY